jgi:hypothetical protein
MLTPEERKAKHRARAKAYYQANREKRKAYQRAYYWNDPIKAREAALKYQKYHLAARMEKIRAWQKANPEKRAAHQRKYWDTHPGQRTVYKHVRRVRITGSRTHFTAADVREKLRVQCGHCIFCKKKLTKYQVDHLVPVCRGGSNEACNIAIVCKPCNLHKMRQTSAEFVQSKWLRMRLKGLQ